MFAANTKIENAVQLSRFDVDNPLSSCSSHPILLEERNWTTCEHYVQAKILRSNAQSETVDKLVTAKAAIAYAKPWYRRKIPNYKKMAPVLMSRALYTKVQMYDEVREALLATDDKWIIETSQYDYFWGIGRDLRGHNHLGKIWMNIREKLKTPYNDGTTQKHTIT